MAKELSTLNDPPAILEGPQLLHDLIHWENLLQSPALDFTSKGTRRKYSYQDLLSCVTSLQSQIHESLGTSKLQAGQTAAQHVVPVFLPQSPGLYISQLAILRSGGAFCPINLDAPKDRIKFVVGDVSASLIITTREFLDVVSWENGPNVILVEEFPDVVQQEIVEEHASRGVVPDDIAYVMYTSGSSGTPKGVAVSHLAVSQSLLAHERHIPHFDRFLQFAAPSFDVSVFEIFFPLVRGSTLVGCNRSQLLEDLPGTIHELEIDAAELTPTVVGSLLQKRSNVPGLELLLTIGEMLTWPIVQEFGGSETQSNMLYGMYGPTEAAIHCTIFPRMQATTKPGNIGVPFDTVSTFIAAASKSLEDAANLKFLPIGEIGELIVGGPQVAQGYLNREEQNKAAFVHFEGKKYYRTGDKARQLDDGTIEILGRMSAGQVKLRGQRVELGEIEEVIYKHPGVKTAVAMVLNSVLVVFVLHGAEPIESQDVVDTCGKWLPKFMIPSDVVLLQNFPYLPSGKVDRRKLESEYQSSRSDGNDVAEKSATKTERAVRDVLQDTLGNFSSNISLAAAGVDSLLSIKIASKLRAQGFKVGAVAVLQASTFKSLVELCDIFKSTDEIKESKATVRGDDSALLNGHAKDVEYTMQCTPLQSAMLAETSMDRKAYRNWVELELDDVTDIHRVTSILHELAASNSILRTGFTESQDHHGFVQIIWRNLADSQIECVKSLNRDFDEARDNSLHRPIRFQLLQLESSTKVLVHIHHALYDAWSLELLLDDLNTSLMEKPLPERAPFSDIVDAYQDGTLIGDSWASKDYWRDHLALLDLAKLPNFHTGKMPAPSLIVERLQSSISTFDVELAARRFSTSPQSLFQAAYALVLSSYLGSTDVCFGTVFSGRTLPIDGIEEITGPCLATLPIRVDISTSASIQDLVKELNSTNRKHLEYSTLPLRDIKAAGGVNPQQSLFDSLLIWQQTLHSYDHKREYVSLVNTVDNLEFNLTLEVIPGLGDIELKANYQQAIFPSKQIRALLRQVEQLVKAIIADESTTVEAVFNQLGPDILSMENEKPETHLKAGSLSSSVENMAATDPNRPAIEFATSIDSDEITVNRLTYSELNSYANKIGHYLLERNNVLPDELVCICMEKCLDLYSSILATAKTGAGYLPLTPDVPSDRLQYILQEAKIETVVTHSSHRSLFKQFKSVKVVYLDDIDLQPFSTKNLASKSAPEMISYCVFTSGSTGTPKGVMVTQGNLLSNLDVLQDMYPASTDSRFLQSCSQAFDVSVFEIFFTWRVGGVICSAVKDVLFRDIENAIRLMNVTHLSLTPTVAALVDPKKVPKVEFLVTAGEGVTRKVFNSWADRGLWQGYGPSETTNICTVNPRVSKNDSINNIGPPFKNTSAFVLAPTPEFTLVPRGGVGEFCFGGSQVFRGYMDSTQNVGKIIEHPKYGRLYRSGDFGRFMPDGSLVFTGRKDDQVKIRGQRVELGEINNIMLKSDQVADCIAMVLGHDNDSSQRLVCFWTSRLESTGDIECVQPDRDNIMGLFKNLDSALPAYMIPSALVPVSYMPSTTQGKIDKRLLIRLFEDLDVAYLDSASQTMKASSDHEWTHTEQVIAQGVADVVKLPVGDIGPDTSFYNLGIDSISAIQLSKILTQRLKTRVEISDILKCLSVLRLAEAMADREEMAETNGTMKSKHFDFGFDEQFLKSTTENFSQSGKIVQSVLPCTPLQEAMLSAAEASTEKLYDNSVTFDISGDVKKLELCWREMVKRHEILRTCFVSTEMPQFPYVQVVLQDYNMKFGSISSIADRTSQRDLDPPYSLDIIRSSGKAQLVVSMHHALYDGVALSVLYEEVEMLYSSKALPGPVSFTPFLQSMISMDLDKADQFWAFTLKNCSSPKFKSIGSTSSSSQQSAHTRIQRIRSKSSLSRIENGIKKYSTTLLAACHTAWSALLSERFQETDICFGNIVSGRTIPVDGIERLVAPCFNTIPARLQNIHNTSYLEAFRKLQALNADSLPFQSTPLRRIQSKFSPDGSRLFDTLFILQQPARELDSSIWSISDDSGAMDFPIVCEVVPKHSDDTLEIILHSYTSVISEEDAQLLLEAFDVRLQAALQNPRRQILSSEVKEQIIYKMESQEKAESKASDSSSEPTTMSAEESNLRDVIATFTSVPLESIGKDLSIFKLGLDSISTVQVATRLRKQGHSVRASDILENPTIAQLSKFLSQSTSSSDESEGFDFAAFDNQYREIACSKLDFSPGSVATVLPCTTVQQGMLAQSLHSDGLEYVNSIEFELDLDVLVSKLRDAWQKVSESNEMLRTSFAATEDPKHPFIMVQHQTHSLRLPWTEHEKETSSQSVSAEEIFTHPWNLVQYTKDGKQYLRFTAHHALYDAQSMQMLLSDVTDTYADTTTVNRPPVTSLLGAILQDSNNNGSERQVFWEREENKIIVNRFPDLTPLRVDDKTSSVRETSSKSSSGDLEALCRSHGVTMQAAAQSAWARLLATYTGETSTTFGMTLSGRSIHEEADKIAFPSIVTLPVRCNIVGTNAELLSRTMSSNSLLHKHQFTPLTSIQKWAGYPEGRIFDTLFAYQKVADSQDSTQPPWKIVKEEATADYAVSLEVQPVVDDKITLRLTFREDLIPVEHAELLLQQYDALLLDTLKYPKNACDVAPITTNELLSITPAEERVLPAPVALLHEFVELHARDRPDRKALEFATNLDADDFQSTTWTYSQMNQEANKLANLLLQHNVEPGQMVAVCFDKCAEASFTIIGILKAGCSYIALDTGAPADRLKYIVQDSGAKLVVTAGKPGKMIADILEGEIINLDSAEILSGCSSYQPKLARDVTPEDVAYCLYTSGTTGTPKGCLITHENTVQFMLAFSRLFAGHWDDKSKYLQFASFHFDVSVMEQFWSWSVGICVASAPRDLIFEDIPGAIKQLGITHIDLTPSLARLLHPDDVPTLCKGAFITGGEQLKQEILDVWGEHACIYNGYGPTEATIGCTMYPRVPKNGKPSNIGPAYVNVGSFVLKPGTELPVLRGGIGELCVSGKLVGKGYLNRADLTAEKFPTLKAFDERVYRTGDLVRILHDGSFIFLGRADDQVKLRGQRLELTEINEVIKKGVDDIQEVVTLVLKHSTRQKEQLVTFFVTSVPSNNAGNLVATMREACKSRLPGYMVPTHFIPIKSLPLSPNNKADSKQLATIYNDLSVEDLQKLGQAGQHDHEWSDSEMRVLDIVAKILQVEHSSLRGGFTIFELGIDSISIIGFSRALQNAGLDNAKLSVVKNNPAIKALVRALLDARTADQGRENAYVAAAQSIAAFEQRHKVAICAELGVEGAKVEKIVPCTPVQEGMIYRFLESEFALYFNKFEFVLEEGVDVEKLMRVWGRVVEQLEVLRMKFVATDDGFAQIVLRKGDGLFEEKARDYEVIEKTLALKAPYSVAVENNPAGKSLKLQVFHGLYDGNSLTMLMRRVIDEYQELEPIDHGPSFTSSLPYGPLAQIPGSKEFWTTHLKDWSSSNLPDNLEGIIDIVATKAINNLQGFDALRKQLGVTPQALIQAAWVLVLQTITSPNLTIGIVTSGRTIDFNDADKVIGPLFNTVPFTVHIQPDTKSSALVSQCHDINMQMQDYQHTPLKDIQKWSPAKPGQPLFDTLFVFQRPEAEDEEFAKGVWTEVEGNVVADYPLAFEATLSPDSSKLSLTLVAQGSAVSQATADRLLDQFYTVLREMLESAGENVIEVIDGEVTRDEFEAETRPTSSNTYDNPFTWTLDAQTIRSEIAQLAKVSEDSIQGTSSIFELGLDSIDVIKLASRLKKRGIDIRVSAIVKAQTIANIAANISAKDNIQKGATGASLAQMSKDLTEYLESVGKLPPNVEAVLPATPLQQSMVNEMINSEYKRYFNVDGFKLGRDVDIVRLRAAINTVVEQSPIMRTTFVQIDDPKSAVSYAQIVHTAASSSYSSSSVSLKYADSFENSMKTFQTEAATAAAEKQELLQTRFVKAGDAKYLVIAISHALYDGTSLRGFHEDIQTAYHSSLSVRPDFMPFLDEVFQSTTEDAKKFWRTTLSNLPPATFPRKVESKENSQRTTTRLEKRSRTSLSAIEALCKSSRITLQTLGQTCWALVLSHLMGQLDIVFGSVLSCRDSEEANEVMFPLMNTVAVRSVIHGSLGEMLSYMQDMSDSTRQFQHFPLGTAQAYALASRRDEGLVGDTTLFDTLFIYQGRRSTVEEGKLYGSVYGTSDVEFPVCVEMEIVDDGYLSWTTACKSIASDAAETEAIIDALELVLEAVISAPDKQIIVSGADGISICGLPAFRTKDEQKKATPEQSKPEEGEWSSTEKAIREALHTLSDVPEDSIRKDTTIFYLGLDSISILKLPALLKKQGIRLSVSTIMKEQTVFAMAKAAEGSMAHTEEPVDVNKILAGAINDLDISDEFAELEEEVGKIQSVMPATAGQEYMVRQWQVSQGAMFYQKFTYALPGPIDEDKLETTWKTLSARHEILRTGYIEIGSKILQVTFKDPPNQIIYDRVQGELAATRNAHNDLRLPPINLVIEGAEKSSATMKLVLHHVLYDGISLPILIDEFQALFRGDTLPASDTNFKSFVAQFYSASSSPSTKEKWKSYLTTPSPLYPSKTSLPSNKRTEVYHPSTPTRDLKPLAQETGVSIDALFLAGLSKINAQSLLDFSPNAAVPSVTFGVYLANRAPFEVDLSAMAAPTLNLLPLRVQEPLERSIEDIARDIQRDVNMIGNKDMVSASLSQIYEWTGTRVNFFVNILKSTNAPPPSPSQDGGWEPLQDLGKRGEIVQNIVNENMGRRDENGEGAYLPSMDIELRYHEGKVDMGVFAPVEMAGVADAQKLIEDFTAFWK